MGYADRLGVYYRNAGVTEWAYFPWSTTDTNRWTFTCVDLAALGAEFALDSVNFGDVEDFGKVEILSINLYDTQSRGALYADEIYIGDKNAQFDIVQVTAAAAPGEN